MPAPPLPERFAVALDAPARPPRGRVSVRGDLDLATAPLLAERLLAFVGEGYVHLELDLHAVPFCDVAGLNALLATSELLRSRGGRLSVHDPCRSLQRQLEVLGLTEALEIARVPRPTAAPDDFRAPSR